MMDLKSLIAKSATDAELNRIKLALNRKDHSMAPENYRPFFEKHFIKVGTTLSERPNNCINRTPEEITGHITLRACGDHQNDSRS